MDIEFLLTQPESKTLEFKRDLSSLKPILKTIVAFANTAGGTLIIGHSPEEDAPGIKDIFQAEERLANAIADSIKPSFFPEIEIKTVKGKNVIIVRVYHQSTPHYIKSEGTIEGIYLRFGSTTRKAGPEMVNDLLRAKSNLSFDQIPCGDLDKTALDVDRVKDFFKQVKKGKNNDSTLEMLGILISEGELLRLSNGGLILFGKDQYRGRYFPDARISCARFKGLDKSHFLDRQDIEGTLLEALEPTLKFISRNTRLEGVIRSLQREDIPEYPEIPLREALVNAIAHANYAIPGRILVAIYDDRLEIQNAGMLPYGFTLENFKSGISHVRNKVIARICRELHLIEEWGSGYRRIKNYCNEHGYPIPEWEEFGTAMRVIFRPHPGTTSKAQAGKALEEMPLGLSVRQQEIVEILSKEEALKMREILNRLASPPAERTLKDDLKFLRDNQVIDYKGKSTKTVWFLLKKK